LLAQLAIAAVMRHSFAGLAIPSFPLSTPEGDWLPKFGDFRVAIHFAHRLMALAITVAVSWFVLTLLRDRRVSRPLQTAAAGLIGLLSLQICLGASVVWSGRNPEVTTAHEIVGATTLALTFLLTWVLHRDAIEARSAPATTNTSRQSVPQTSAFSRA
jgi:cytochrome c oxidase assembly protein subunit 15